MRLLSPDFYDILCIRFYLYLIRLDYVFFSPLGVSRSTPDQNMSRDDG